MDTVYAEPASDGQDIRPGINTPAIPTGFILHGAGWGHGVGLCQIGAAAMSAHGCTFDRILAHYFRGSCLTRLY